MPKQHIIIPVITRNKIYPVDLISTPQGQYGHAKVNKLWKNVLHKTSLIKQHFTLPDMIPSENMVAERSKILENILLNKCCADNPSRSSYVYIFLGILLGVSSTLMITSYPQQYPIGNPKYWYESVLNLIFSWGPLAAAFQINLSFFLMGISGKNTVRTCFVAYGYGTITSCIVSGILYMIWVTFAGLPFPMPFHGYITGMMTWNSMFVVFWFQCPKHWRDSSFGRRKMIFCFLFFNVNLIGEVTYKMIQMSFVMIPTNMHWPLVIVLILVRELHAWGLGHLGKKVAGFPDISVEIVATMNAVLRYLIFLTVDGGSITALEVSYVILVVDFSMNLICCFTIIWCNRHWSAKNQKRQIKAALNLIINESVEFTIPITYLFNLLTAYFGPNAEILGNIKNNYWQYTSIEDLDERIKWIALLFLVDFASLAISFLLFQYFCKINVFRMYLQVQDQVGHIQVLATGYYVAEVNHCLLYKKILLL